MERERIKRLGSQPLNGNDCYGVLGIVFDWIEEKKNEAIAPLVEPPMASPEELEDLLKEAGYYYERKIAMPRNQFEENDPSLNMAKEDRDFLGDRLYVPLPPLSDGHHYEISSLPSGASAVVIKKGDETVSPDSLTDRFARKSSDDKIVDEMHKHDRFGRRYAGGNENG